MKSNKKLIRSAFVSMMIVNMFVVMAGSICSFMDNIVIGRILGTDALAAAGYFSPVATSIGLYGTIVLGVQILVGNFIGSGKREKLNTLFFSAFTVLGVVFGLVAVLCILFRESLATMLGAKGVVHEMLCGYILGFMPGVPVQALCAMLMALVSFNNDMRRSYISAGIMAAGNAAGDLLLAGMGMFGIGLASTISSVLALAVLLPGYVRKDKALSLIPARPDLRLTGQAVILGLSSVSFTIGLVIKNTLINYTLSASVGAHGVAIANVLVSVCGILGIVSGGIGSAHLSLSGLYFGEEDRSSFVELFKFALRTGEICFIIIVALVAVCSGPLATVFFSPGTPEWEMARQMFRLGFWFFPVNMFLYCMLNAVHAQGRTRLVTFISFFETAMTGVMVFLTVPQFGLSAAWLANTWADLISVGIVLVLIWGSRKKIDFHPATLMNLPDSFGASPEECREYSLENMKDVVAVSESITEFCKERKTDLRCALTAGLCVEEMTREIMEYGFRPGKASYVNVRVVVRDELTVRIRDNCPEFDPRKRLEVFYPESPEKNVGIRLTAGLARQMDYYNNAGINTLVLKM